MRILVEDELMDKNKQQNSVRESKPQSKFKGLVAVDFSTAFLGTLLSARPECIDCFRLHCCFWFSLQSDRVATQQV